MNTELITVTEYCLHHHTEPEFIDALEQSGLVTLTVQQQERFIDFAQLPNLEAYTRWHYDMDINIAGIDAMRHMLDTITNLQHEMRELKARVSMYEM